MLGLLFIGLIAKGTLGSLSMMSICSSIHPSVHLSVHPPVHPFVHPSVHPSVNIYPIFRKNVCTLVLILLVCARLHLTFQKKRSVWIWTRTFSRFFMRTITTILVGFLFGLNPGKLFALVANIHLLFQYIETSLSFYEYSIFFSMKNCSKTATLLV